MREDRGVARARLTPQSVAACRAAYNEHAAEYARLVDPTLVGLVERMAELADARPGVKLLDLATGTGGVASSAAARGASVVGVDVSAPMLRVARELSPDIEFREADAHALPFSAGEFDVVVCALALSHFDEPSRAIREVLRVLREGGPFVASTWGTAVDIPSLSKVVAALERHGASDKGYTVDEETWFYAEQGSDVLRNAGFADVGVKTERFTGRFADAEAALQWTLAWPCGSARLARLDKRNRDAFLNDARQALAGADLSWNFVFNVYIANKTAGR
jgi:SAM-dependent methyltransferase